MMLVARDDETSEPPELKSAFPCQRASPLGAPPARSLRCSHFRVARFRVRSRRWKAVLAAPPSPWRGPSVGPESVSRSPASSGPADGHVALRLTGGVGCGRVRKRGQPSDLPPSRLSDETPTVDTDSNGRHRRELKHPESIYLRNPRVDIVPRRVPNADGEGIRTTGGASGALCVLRRSDCPLRRALSDAIVAASGDVPPERDAGDTADGRRYL